jgi:hypothetical protein
MAAKVNRTSAQLEQFAEVMDVLRLDKQNALVRRLVKKQQDGTLGQPTTESDETDAEGSDDMAEDDKVNFGDTTHNVYTIADQGKSVAEKAAGSLLPIILASALGGGGLGAAAMALPALLKDDPPPVVTPSDTDTDTQYLLEFAEGKANK